ncbi:MAG: PKD domain-containing protein [Candidatus Hadarchaeales archaeon]
MRKLLPLLLVLSVLGIPSALSHPAWTSKAPTPSAGGYGQAAVGAGNYVYVVRCYSATSAVQFWRYNPSTNSWTSLSTNLEAGTFRNGTCLAWDGGDYLYALAGARYEDPDRRIFLRYSISGNSWEVLPDTPGPQGAGDALCWSGHDGKIYAILGSKEHGTVFARYDPSTSWELRSPPPAGTDDGCSLVWAGGRYLYALRGEYYESSPLQDFWRYDLETDTWTPMSPIPDPGGVGDGGSLLWDPNQPDYIYALGGGAFDENGGQGFYRYRISANTWETLEDLPYPVGYYNGNRLALAGGRIYYWQGTPSTWSGGGNSFCVWEEVQAPPANNPPVASFQYSPQNPVAGDSVQFTDQSVDSDGTVASWYWEFGDGATSTERNPTHIYQRAGSYTVRLTVTDDGGLSGSTSKTITVLAPNQPPVASFQYSPKNPVAGEPVQFVENSVDPDGTIVSLYWEFGDGATSTERNPSHIYQSPGTYAVQLTVVDDRGQVALCVRIITVSPPAEENKEISVPENKVTEYVATAECVPVKTLFENLEKAVKTIQLATEVEKVRVAEDRILEGKAAYLQLTLENNLPVATKIYDNRSLQLLVTRVEAGREVEVAVDSPTPAGKTVLLNVEKALLPSQLVVLVDNAEIPMADNYEDVMDPTNEEVCEYLLLMGGKQIQVLVSIPRFSRRVITIRGPLAAEGTRAPLLLAVGILLIVAVLLYTFRKTKSSFG